jgi:hypothetical protein
VLLKRKIKGLLTSIVTVTVGLTEVNFISTTVIAAASLPYSSIFK